jgi:hypothetical protein
MEQLKWKIYYGDGSTFDSSQGEPLDAPVFGVIAIIGPTYDKRDPSYRMHRWDRFYWNQDIFEGRGQWWGGFHDVAEQRLCNGDPIEALKIGMMIDTPEYQAILERANKERKEIYGSNRGNQYKDNGDNFKFKGTTD